MNRILYAFHNRQQVDKENWPLLFKVGEKNVNTLHSVCNYLAEDFNIDDYLN